MKICGGGIGRRKYKSMRILQLTVCTAVRVETTRRKSGTSWRTYTQIIEKKVHAGCKPSPTYNIKSHFIKRGDIDNDYFKHGLDIYNNWLYCRIGWWHITFNLYDSH